MTHIRIFKETSSSYAGLWPTARCQWLRWKLKNHLSLSPIIIAYFW